MDDHLSLHRRHHRHCHHHHRPFFVFDPFSLMSLPLTATIGSPQVVRDLLAQGCKVTLRRSSLVLGEAAWEVILTSDQGLT